MELITRPKIISSEAQSHILAEGLTIDEMMVVVDWSPSLRPWTVVTVNGHEIYPEYWHRARPKPGQKVTIALRPAGGGGGGGSSKGIIAAVASIAIMIVAAVVAPYLEPLIWGATTAAGISAANAVIAAGISIVGSLALGALIRPGSLGRKTLGTGGGGTGSLSADESKTYSVTGGTNSVQRYGVVPRVYGRHRFIPPFAADPYVISSGPVQTIYLLLDFGYGPLLIEDIRIGNSPITDFPSAEIVIHPEFKAGDPLKLYTNDVLTSQVGAVLTKDVENIRVVGQAGAQIWTEITFPGGLIEFDPQGLPKHKLETITLEIADPASPNTWMPFSNFAASAWFQSEGGVDTTGRVTVGSYPVEMWIDERTAVIMRVPPDAVPPGMGMMMDWGGDSVYIMSAIKQPPEWAPPGAGGATIKFDEHQYQLTLNRFPINRPPPNNKGASWGGWAIGNATIWYNKGLGASGPITVSFGDPTKPNEIYFFGETRSPRQISIVVNMGAEKDWRVRVVRKSALSTDQQIINGMTWNTLRSVRYQPPIAPKSPRTIMEMRITASEQISGQIQNVNALCTSILKDPRADIVQFTDQRVPTRNPAWIYADVLTGTANPKKVAWSMLNETVLKSWADVNDGPGPQGDPTLATCDLIVDFRTTIGELSQTVCATGYAAPVIQDGQYSVLRDRADRIPVQMFTNRNASGFSTSRKWVDTPHGFKVRHVDEDTWEKVETFVYADGYDAQNATKFESLELMGVIRGKQVWRAGRYFYAAGVLRKERLSFNADIENLVCQRGDLVLAAHDVLLANMVGRARGIVGDVVEVDILIETIPTHVQIRDAEGNLYAPAPIVAVIDPSHVQVQPATAALLSDGCIMAFGTLNNTTSEWIVDTIKPGNDLTASIECIEHAPGIYLADQGPVPPYVPPNGTGFWGPLSGVANLILSVNPFVYNEAGIPFHNVIVDWDVPTTWVPVRYVVERLITVPASTTGGSIPNANVRVIIGDTTDTVWQDAVDARFLAAGGTTVSYFVTAISALGNRGEEVGASTTLRPDTTPPPAVTLFSNALPESVTLSWLKPDVPDLAYYQIRFTPNLGLNGVWEAMSIFAERVSPNTTSATLNSRVGTYAIRAVDTSGNWSPPTYIAVTTDFFEGAALITTSKVPAWDGTFQDTEIVNNELRLKPGADGRYPTEGWFFPKFGITLSHLIRVRVRTSINQTTFPVSSDPLGAVDSQVWISTLREMPKLNSAWFQPLSTAVPLAGSPANFTPLSSTSHTYYDMIVGTWALKLTSADGIHTPSIKEAEVSWLFDSRTEHADDVEVVGGAQDFYYGNSFYIAPALTVTLNDGAPGDHVVRTLSQPDHFRLEIRNAAGGLVTGKHIDWIAVGYGLGSPPAPVNRAPAINFKP